MRSTLVSLLYSENLVYRISRHIIIFSVTVLIFTSIVYLQSEQMDNFISVLKSVLTNAVFFFLYAYITAFLLVPSLLVKQKYAWFFISFILIGIILSVVKFLFSDYLFYAAIAGDMNDRIDSLRFSYVLVNTKDMTFVVAIFLIAKFTKDNYHMKKRLHELNDARLSSEIKHIKNQLDPHVVFNNLNNLYAISIKEREDLLPYLTKFKNLLTYYFKKANDKVVALSTELSIINDYIDLEKLRYGSRVSISKEIEGDVKNKKIIPLVLFNFVENCFEHGCSEESGKAWIKLGIKVSDRGLVFHVSNSKPKGTLYPNRRARVTEFATKKKLEMLYPGKYLLRIDDREDMYCLDLKLKI